ncbi:unnamed protein product, partial [Brenthis ino]
MEESVVKLEPFESSSSESDYRDVEEENVEPIAKEQQHLEDISHLDPLVTVNTGMQKRQRKQPERYGYANICTSVGEDGMSYAEAISGPEKQQWLQAMAEELRSFQDNNAWEVVDRPDNIAQPYPKFKSTFKAYNDSIVCPQIKDGIFMGTLDCLRLNIFAPTSASFRNRLPIMVLIHGGGFIFGYSSRYSYGPKHLVRHDVILVTFNYRLGPYGFMCLDTPGVPGNQGLKDQLLLLRWVKAHIASFGGDVNKITLIGESSGSVCAEAHLLSKQEKLYTKLILESGVVAKPGIIIDSDPTMPIKISERMGFKTKNVSEALSFLTKSDPKWVVTTYNEQKITLGICIEKEFENVESFLTEHPLNLGTPQVKEMPILAGYNNREGLMMDALKPYDYFKKENFLRDSLEKIFNYDESFIEMEKIVHRFYFGDREITDDFRHRVIDFISDFYFNHPIQGTLDKLYNCGANIFQYLFSYDGGINYIKNKYKITSEGAAHGDELEYLFVLKEKTACSSNDQVMIDRMTKLWTNFAKTGDPTPHTTSLLPVKWMPITGNSTNYLNIDSELSMDVRPFNDRLSFWELFFKANKRKLKGYRENI